MSTFITAANVLAFALTVMASASAAPDTVDVTSERDNPRFRAIGGNVSGPWNLPMCSRKAALHNALLKMRVREWTTAATR